MKQLQASRRRVFIILLILVAFLYMRIVSRSIFEFNPHSHSFLLNGLVPVLVVLLLIRIFRRRRSRSL